MSISFKPNKDDKLFQKWRKGGMSTNGLRMSGEVIDYFYTPGRSTILPDPGLSGTDKWVSSIGTVQMNGTKQALVGKYGPGSLLSTNLQVRNQHSINEENMGAVRQNGKKSQYTYYNTTDNVLVENLRRNPLSIYAVGDAKDAPIPAFFAFVKPDNYNTYKTEQNVQISDETKELYVDGSPNVGILGMAEQNPFMGLTVGTIPNSEPEFSGKTYGGWDNGSAKTIAEDLYNSMWTSDNKDISPEGQYWNPNTQKENFSNGNEQQCYNKSLITFAQGYNIADQVQQGKMNQYISPGNHAPTNLPWGPYKGTGNPITQQGGVWGVGNNPWPTKPVENGVVNNVISSGYKTKPLTVPFNNPYKNGLPGNLIG